MVFDIIIIVLLIILAAAGVYFFFDMRKNIFLVQVRAEKELEECNFTPYLVRIPDETQVYDEEKKLTSQIINPNSFRTVVFEDKDYCKLLSGGWIRKENTQKDFSRIVRQIPARVKEDTLLRNGPSSGYQAITRLSKGQIVEVNDDFGNWYKIKLNKISGYVLKSTIEKY